MHIIGNTNFAKIQLTTIAISLSLLSCLYRHLFHTTQPTNHLSPILSYPGIETNPENIKSFVAAIASRQYSEPILVEEDDEGEEGAAESTETAAGGTSKVLLLDISDWSETSLDCSGE